MQSIVQKPSINEIDAGYADVIVGITGANGFLGRHVVSELQRLGVKEKNICAPSSKEVNLLSQSECEEFVEEIDVLIHLAADVGGIMYNKKHPFKLIANNSLMSVNIMMSAAKTGLRKIVNTGTTCMYPADAIPPFHEEDIFTGYPALDTAPYAIAKILLFELAKAAKKQNDMEVVNLIPVNLYGPGDHFIGEDVHVMPSLIRRFVEATRVAAPAVEIWGDGTASREFVHVRDAARAFAVAAMNPVNCPHPLNIGSGCETTISELVSIISKESGYQGMIEWDVSKPTGTQRRKTDISRAMKHLGFVPTIDLITGVRETIQHYKDIVVTTSIASENQSKGA